MDMGSQYLPQQIPYIPLNQPVFRQPTLHPSQQQNLIQQPNYNAQRPVSMVPNLPTNLPLNFSNTNRPKSYVEASLNRENSLENSIKDINYERRDNILNNPSENNDDGLQVNFLPLCRYEDSQAIRAVAFHPSGRYFVIGTNSKQMIICKYPDLRKVR